MRMHFDLADLFCSPFAKRVRYTHMLLAEYITQMRHSHYLFPNGMLPSLLIRK